MLIGDQRSFALEIQPVVPSWMRRAPSERGPWAKLSIWLSGDNLCRHWLPSARSIDDGVYVPLAPIADWLVRSARHIAYEESARAFATDVDLPSALEYWKTAAPAKPFDQDSWDDERFEWSERHFLAAGADGAWLPNLAFVRVDDGLWVSAGDSRFATPDAPRFLYRPDKRRVSWQEAEQTLTDFVDQVGSSLRAEGLEAAYPWRRGDGAFRQVLEVGLMDFLGVVLSLCGSESERMCGGRSEEVLRNKLDLPADASPIESVALLALRDLEVEAGIGDVLVQCDLETRARRSGRLFERRSQALDAAVGGTPEEQGYEAAYVIRRSLGLDGRALDEPAEFLQAYFDIEVEDRPDLRTNYDHCVAGAHRDGHGRIILLSSSQTSRPWSRRMEILRGMGHLLLDASPSCQALGAGSSTRAVGPRRRRSGTFAAEMLLPRDALRQRSGGVLDAVVAPEIFPELMAEYGVGARMAAWQCWNANLLSSRDVVEDLIDTYGAQGPS